MKEAGGEEAGGANGEPSRRAGETKRRETTGSTRRAGMAFTLTGESGVASSCRGCFGDAVPIYGSRVYADGEWMLRLAPPPPTLTIPPLSLPLSLSLIFSFFSLSLPQFHASE